MRMHHTILGIIACRRRRFNAWFSPNLTWPSRMPTCVCTYIGGRWGGAGRHGAGAEAGGAGGGGNPRRRRHNNGGVVHLPAVPVLLQVEPWDMSDDHLLLQLQVRPRRQVQPRAGQMRLQRLRQRQLVGRPPAVYLTGMHRIDLRILPSYNGLGLNMQSTTAAAGHE